MSIVVRLIFVCIQVICALAAVAVALAAPQQQDQYPVQILKQEADVNPEGYQFQWVYFAHHDISEQLQNTFNSSLFAKTVFLFSLAVFIVRFGWFNIKQISKAYKVTKRICSLIWKVNMFLLSTVSTLIRRTTKSNGSNICCTDYFNQNRIHVGKEAVIRRC